MCYQSLFRPTNDALLVFDGYQIFPSPLETIDPRPTHDYACVVRPNRILPQVVFQIDGSLQQGSGDARTGILGDGGEMDVRSGTWRAGRGGAVLVGTC